MSKERSILFSAPMVRACLDGSKTQTRRIVKPQPDVDITEIHHARDGIFMAYIKQKYGQEYEIKCPYGKVGDLLWVREAWRVGKGYDEIPGSMFTSPAVHYEADSVRDDKITWGRYRHARFMPRWSSRLTLKITDVRVERLNDISEEDAKAEGVAHENMIVSVNCYGGATHEEHDDRYFYDGCQEEGFKDPVEAYQSLWESINSKGSWSLNPWVWVIGFNREDVKL